MEIKEDKETFFDDGTEDKSTENIDELIEISKKFLRRIKEANANT